MKKIIYSLCITLLFVLGLWVTACGEGGTETGNPQIQDEGDGTEGDDDSTGEDSDGDQPIPVSAPDATTAEQVLDQVCSKLTECFTTLDDTSCEEGVLETDNIDDDLGLDVSFESYEAIINAELDGTIVPIAEAATTCLAELSALSCSDPTVQSAYSSASPANFTNVHSMIPDGEDSCEGVY